MQQITINTKALRDLISAAVITFVLILAVLCCQSAYAATAPTSNVSGNLSTWSDGVDFYIVDWNIAFTVNSGAIGDTIPISTNNVTMWTPRDVTVGSGEKIGVLEYVSGGNNYPNSWDQRNNYQIRLTKEVASASVTLNGSTTTSFNRFIASSDHYEAVWITVGGVTAASGTGHMHSCSWSDSDTWGCIVGGIPALTYENGSISDSTFTGLVHPGNTGTTMQVGDQVVWRLKENFFHLMLRDGVSIGDEFTEDAGYSPGSVPRSRYIATEPYGFLECTGEVDWKYKVLWCNEYDCGIEITQVGSQNAEWSLWQSMMISLNPQNSSTVKFNEKRTEDCDYYIGIKRGDWTYYHQDTSFNYTINSQEVLSEASFYARVNTSVIHGTITPSVQTEQGATITINYSPEEGYELEYIKVDGANVSLSTYANSYTFTNTQGTHTVDVKYKIKTFTISTSVTNGSITPTAVVNWGTSKTVSYSPNAGYLLNSVTVDGSAVNITSYPDSYTFTNIKANHSVAVTYAKPTAGKSWALYHSS